VGLSSATIHGYPRIGPDRELKRALEAHWAGRLDGAGLQRAAADLRRRTWETLRDAGLDEVPSNTSSLYDHVLDTAVMVGAVPPRFAAAGDDLATYFAMARGGGDVPALELTKWFDTNYHHLVPELGPDTALCPAGTKPLDEFAEARALGLTTRPVLLGPVTFLLRSKPADGAPAAFAPLNLLEPLLDVYADLLERLAAAGADWVQLDEPAFVQDRTAAELAALARAYRRLGGLAARPRLLVATYFDSAGDALTALLDTPVDGLALDLVRGAADVERLAWAGGLPGRRLVAGVVDGRNVWAADLRRALSTLAVLHGLADEVTVSSSCSLLHVPVDLDAEPPGRLGPDVRARLAFARQKVGEVVTLARALREGTGAVAAELAASDRRPTLPGDPALRARVAGLGPQDAHRPRPAPERAQQQREALDLPPLPTTTIGSFPQTAELRAARSALAAGRLDRAAYEARMRTEIERVVALQEDLGMDVLVHGEPERNDMVQYFAEQLDGFTATTHGWVQSYGSRCVRPPILHGDVNRPAPMTVAWSTFAQSRTSRPVKGMLTGPVTMLAWSFVREDQPAGDTALQVALGLRDEVSDLEAAGIRIVQVDEPALRELLPLRREQQPAYLDWATRAFRVATSGVRDTTQVHTHMCYSEFGDILDAIVALDADVTSVEAARSRMELAEELADAGWHRGIGPGVYDIHSPRVPGTEEVAGLLRKAVAAVGPERLWVNPDCGLKTRDYDEVVPSLRHLVAAAHQVRGEIAAGANGMGG